MVRRANRLGVPFAVDSLQCDVDVLVQIEDQAKVEQTLA